MVSAPYLAVFEDPGCTQVPPINWVAVSEAMAARAQRLDGIECKCPIPLQVTTTGTELGVVDGLGAGDSVFHPNLLPPDLGKGMFERIRDEVDWCVMRHKGGEVPRLVSMQATIAADGTAPLYRHPADEQPAPAPWTPAVNEIRLAVEQRLGQHLNHALVQWYRGGTDYISEHADKTLDIARGTAVVNVSFGATRQMILRGKRGCRPEVRTVKQRIAMPNNSMFILGWDTNTTMTHMIKQDKRERFLKRADELFCDGHRISITFRTVDTYVTPDQQIFGQGGKIKEKPLPRKSTTSPDDWRMSLVRASMVAAIGGSMLFARQDGRTRVALALLGLSATTLCVAALCNGESDSDIPQTKYPKGDDESEELLVAFGIENSDCTFDWDAVYGKGFDSTAQMKIVPLTECERAPAPL